MKKVLILMFTVAVLAGCPTLVGLLDKWEGFPNFGYPRASEMFETLTGIPAGTVKTSERVFIYSDCSGNNWERPCSISLVRITSAKVTYVLTLFLGGHEEVKHPAWIVLVIDGRAVTLKTVTEEGRTGEFLYEQVMAAVPPEHVDELFAAADIRIVCWRSTGIVKLTEKGISSLRMLSPQKPQ